MCAAKKPEATEHYVLITNLSYVMVGPVRAHCHALLLSEGKDVFGGDVRRRMRGFGTDPALEIFDMNIPSIDFTSSPAQSGHVFIGQDDIPKPLFSGGIFRFGGEDGIEVQLIKEIAEAEFDIQRFEGTQSERPVLRVWAVLPVKVEQYWNAPYMLVPAQVHSRSYLNRRRAAGR